MYKTLNPVFSFRPRQSLTYNTNDVIIKTKEINMSLSIPTVERNTKQQIRHNAITHIHWTMAATHR